MTPYHSMEIYTDELSIAKIVAELFAQTRALDQPCLMIARPSVNDLVKQTLAAMNVDAGGLMILSSEEMLAALVDDALVDSGRFRAIIGAVLDDLCSGRDICIVTIYADMADLMLLRHNVAGAASLEMLWNEMANRHTFTLACGYSAANVGSELPTMEDLERICREHHRVNVVPNRES